MVAKISACIPVCVCVCVRLVDIHRCRMHRSSAVDKRRRQEAANVTEENFSRREQSAIED